MLSGFGGRSGSETSKDHDFSWQPPLWWELELEIEGLKSEPGVSHGFSCGMMVVAALVGILLEPEGLKLQPRESCIILETCWQSHTGGELAEKLQLDIGVECSGAIWQVSQSTRNFSIFYLCTGMESK